jgi:hypothetical protein
MPTFLDNVYSIWEDLEISYKDKGAGLSKKDYLLKLCGISPSGGNKLDIIKASILKEYKGNEFRCDVLSKIFDALALNWEQVKATDNIEDLNKYVASIVNSSVVVEEVSGEGFVEKLNPYRIVTSPRLDPVQMLHQVGFITDVFKSSGSLVESSFAESIPGKDIVLLKGLVWRHFFFQTIDKDNKFHISVYALLSNLEELQDINYCLFVGRDRFTFRSNKVSLVYSDIKVPLDFIERRTLGDIEYIKAEHKNEYLSTPVYCIL